MLILVLAAGAAHGDAGLSGFVYLDSNENGQRDPGESGRSGVTVSNGRDLVRTDSEGRYQLPRRDDFVRLTRPSGFRSPDWARRGGGDFGLIPEEAPVEFFFIQISDAHVYDRREDFSEFSAPPIPGWLPRMLADWLVLRVLRNAYGRTTHEIGDAFRRELERTRQGKSNGTGSMEGMSALGVLAAYNDEFRDPESELGNVPKHIREAIREVAALAPGFVVSTGDLILEGNNGTPDAVERWFRFYQEVTEATGLPFYNTIGNNELTGTSNPDLSPDDPRLYKALWQQFQGPTHFSFDRGGFHFVALDTHRPKDPEHPEGRWLFGSLDETQRQWLDADLAAHPDAVLVMLNHEPFHTNPDWPIQYDPASDDGIFARHDVEYVLAGHVHTNGGALIDGTRHITTGALSGQRWVVPEELHPRGYRLFYARERRLYSGWKTLGEPVLEILTDASAPGELIALAADRTGPFERVALFRDGVELPLESWGQYFFRAGAEDPGPSPENAHVTLRAWSQDGSKHETSR